MAFDTNGTLTTDKKSGDSFGWDTQTEWEAYQSKTDIEILNGNLQLGETGLARWTFDDADTDTGTAIDVWNSNDASINGATVGVTGANVTYTTNEAYSFGISDSVTTTLSSPFEQGTIAVWAKRDGTSSDKNVGIFDVGEWGNGTGWGIWANNGEDGVGVHDSGSSYPYSNTSYATSWNLYVARYDGTDIDLYINDANHLITLSNASVTADSNISIGIRPNGEGVPNDLDDPRLYREVLTTSEISNLYNTGRT